MRKDLTFFLAVLVGAALIAVALVQTYAALTTFTATGEPLAFACAGAFVLMITTLAGDR